MTVLVAYFSFGLLAALFLRWDTAMWRKSIGQPARLSALESGVCLFYLVGGWFSLAVVVAAVTIQAVGWLSGRSGSWNPHARKAVPPSKGQDP